jgi:hypothetical protein
MWEKNPTTSSAKAVTYILTIRSRNHKDNMGNVKNARITGFPAVLNYPY